MTGVWRTDLGETPELPTKRGETWKSQRGVGPMRRLLAVAAVTAAMLLGTVPAAHAGILCNTVGLCGKVENVQRSTCPLIVANDWAPGVGLAGTRRLVYPGRVSTFKDADGFDSLKMCKHRLFIDGMGWSGWTTRAMKIGDGTYARVQTVKR